MHPSEAPVSFSNLKQMARSPLHYLMSLEGRPDSLSMRLGRLVHYYVLGGRDAPVIWDGERRGKGWADFARANAGCEIATASEASKAKRIAHSVKINDLAGHYLVGRRELPVEWEWCGVRCKTRGIDVLGNGFISELKTCHTSEPAKFSRVARSYAYYAQLAFYRTAARSLGHDIGDAYIVAVETSEPHCVTVLRVGPEALDAGERLCRSWIEQLIVCRESNTWPGYAQSVVEFTASEDTDLIFDDEPEVAA